MARDTAYRYDSVRWAAPLDEFDNPVGRGRLSVELRKFKILSRTKCGIWIDHHGEKKFVNLTLNKKFACESEELARESFVRRKKRQISILSSQLEDAEKALRLLSQK